MTGRESECGRHDEAEVTFVRVVRCGRVRVRVRRRVQELVLAQQRALAALRRVQRVHEQHARRRRHQQPRRPRHAATAGPTVTL